MLLGQKLAENAKIKKSKCDILTNFQQCATVWCTGHFLIYLIATDNKGQACSSVTKVKPLHSEKYESVPITFFACLISDYNLQLRPKK